MKGQVAQGRKILVVLEPEDSEDETKRLLRFSSWLAGSLQKELFIAVVITSSLVHYGQIDPLASDASKDSFIKYVCHSEKDAHAHLKREIQKICPDSTVIIVNMDEFIPLVERMKGDTLFAITRASRRGLIFKRASSIQKFLEKKGVNILCLKEIPLV